MRRTAPLLTAAVIVLAACGSGDAATPAAAPATGARETSATAAPAPTSVSPTAPPAADTAPATTPAATDPVATTAPSGTSAATSPAPTDAPPASTADPAPARPDDGCSSDNSPTAPEVAEGPAPTIEVAAVSAANPLPDVVVRRINCAGGWVNLKNELPADRPLLIWFWAPH